LAPSFGKEMRSMASSHVPVRVPERPATTTEVPSPRIEVTRQNDKPTRFVIKLSSPVPC
jgi:hypothetical protein